jgi:pimeloyl-ACP methyl ester carboxylesterase
MKNIINYLNLMPIWIITILVIQSYHEVAAQQKEKVSTAITTKQTLESASVIKTKYAESNGRKIAYRTIGTGKPIILCQRFRGNLDDWDPAFLEALAKKDYQVIIFDYSGMGSSTGKPSTTALLFAQDVRDLAKALGFTKIIVGGWSLGGWVAQIVTTEFPELVTHTILMGTKPPGKVEFGLEEIFINTAYKPSYTVEDETILFFEPTSETSRAAALKSHKRIAARTTDRDIPVPQSLWQYYTKCAEDFTNDPYGARKKLETTKVPMLVISADHEICFPPQNWFVLLRKLPTTQLLIIPQSGHGVQHQYPKYVAESIDNFVKDFKREKNEK